MKNLKQSHDIVRQNDGNVKKSHRHDVNLRKNSTLYFQVGLIVCLLAAIGLLEMRFESKSTDIAIETLIPDDGFDMEAITFKPYVAPEEKQRVEKREQITKRFIEKFEEVDDNTDLPVEVKIETPISTTSDTSFDSNTLNIEKPIDNVPVDFISIEEVPIYPGCERVEGRSARKKCMSDKISQLVQRKFNGSDIASRYGLSGKQRISVEFQIDKEGKVSNIKTRASHPKLEDEAKRVVNKIPEMEPGKQRDKPVNVRYTLPIIFMVE